MSTGTCGTTVTGTNEGDHVDVAGTSSGGGGSATTGGNGGGTGDEEIDPSLAAGPPQDAGRACLASTDPAFLAAYCAGIGTPAPGDPVVTLADLASFRPTTALELAEPDGWSVAGLPTNLYASAATHVVDGTLLGRPASVRFTPASYAWGYGDGTSALRTVRGASWAALGQAEFTRTQTSHVFAREGSYRVTLDVGFSPEYRFDGGDWTRIAGFVTASSGALDLEVVSAKTVLVAGSCATRPGDPGC